MVGLKHIPVTMILNYDDFGPQVLAYEHLGYARYQWNANGDEHTRDNVKVVVYSGMTRRDVSRKYPIDRSRKRDFRYIEYTATVRYLRSSQRELKRSGLNETARVLKRTEMRIRSGFAGAQ